MERGFPLPLVLANRPLADPGFLEGGTYLRHWVWVEDLEGGACSHNLYTFGPRPQRIG